MRVYGSSNDTFQVMGGGSSKVVIQQIANTFALNALATMSLTGNITTSGNVSATGNVTGGNLLTNSKVVMTPVVYSALAAVSGARAFVNDGNLVASGNFGAQVIGGGSNVVPVWSDGANWYIG